MSGTVLITLERGGSYAPCSAYYRIKREDLHRAAMAQVASMGGPEPEDEYGRDDNVLLSEEDAEQLIADHNRRKLADWRDGWPVTLRVDRWEAFSYYGYDAGDTLG